MAQVLLTTLIVGRWVHNFLWICRYGRRESMKKVLFLLVPLLLMVSCVAPEVSRDDYRRLVEKQDQTLEKPEEIASRLAASPAPSPTSPATEARPIVKLFQDACSGCHGDCSHACDQDPASSRRIHGSDCSHREHEDSYPGLSIAIIPVGVRGHYYAGRLHSR